MKERRAYRSLLQSKREQFWTQKIESEKSSPRQLWSSIDSLLGRGVTPPRRKSMPSSFIDTLMRRSLAFDQLPLVLRCHPSNSRQRTWHSTVSRPSAWMKWWQQWKRFRINLAADLLPTKLLKAAVDVIYDIKIYYTDMVDINRIWCTISHWAL